VAEDAAAQAVAAIAAQLHLRMQQLQESGLIVDEADPGDGKTRWRFRQGFLDSPEGYGFATRQFFTTQLSLLNPTEEEGHYMMQQQRSLAQLTQLGSLRLCLDGRGEGHPNVEYLRNENEAVGQWIVHMSWCVVENDDEGGCLELQASSCMINVALGMWSFGEGGEQQELNERGLGLMSDQVALFCEHMNSTGNEAVAEKVSEDLRCIVTKAGEAKWDHEILVLLDSLCKDLGGATRINCKSAKDRTQLLLSILKAVAICRELPSPAGDTAICYSTARELMWGSGLQVALHNTGCPYFKVAPHALARGLYRGPCLSFAHGLCVGVGQVYAARGIHH